MPKNIKLPTWLNGKNVTALAAAAEVYWQDVEKYLFLWLEQLDETKSALPILDLLAWERDIRRLDGETVELYTLRIKHAVANSEDAGYGLGMERIFKRLGFGYIEINERVNGFDWDMVEIAMIEDELSSNQNLIKELIRQYGRTCRRYYLNALITVDTFNASAVIEFEKEIIG